MNEPNTIEQRLAEIARVLSMSTDTLLSLSASDAAYPASFEAEASEIASNFRMCDADARQLLLHLSRTLAEKSQYPLSGTGLREPGLSDMGTSTPSDAIAICGVGSSGAEISPARPLKLRIK